MFEVCTLLACKCWIEFRLGRRLRISLHMGQSYPNISYDEMWLWTGWASLTQSETFSAGLEAEFNRLESNFMIENEAEEKVCRRKQRGSGSILNWGSRSKILRVHLSLLTFWCEMQLLGFCHKDMNSSYCVTLTPPATGNQTQIYLLTCGTYRGLHISGMQVCIHAYAMRHSSTRTDKNVLATPTHMS